MIRETRQKELIMASAKSGNGDRRIETVWDIVGDVTFCMLVTEDGEFMRARPMTLLSHRESGEFRFMVSADSANVKEVRKVPRVNLSFAEPETQTYASISGKAVVSQDAEIIKSIWTDDAAAFFDGPEDPRIAVIRVLPSRAEYWAGESRSSAAGSWTFDQAPAEPHAKVAM